MPRRFSPLRNVAALLPFQNPARLQTVEGLVMAWTVQPLCLKVIKFQVLPLMDLLLTQHSSAWHTADGRQQLRAQRTEKLAKEPQACHPALTK